VSRAPIRATNRAYRARATFGELRSDPSETVTATALRR
jgi:hypothetical protein